MEAVDGSSSPKTSSQSNNNGQQKVGEAPTSSGKKRSLEQSGNGDEDGKVEMSFKVFL